MNFIMPSTSQIEFDVFIVFLSFGLGFVTNKRFRLLVQVLLILFRMAKWYHETHPTGKKMAREYGYDEQLTQLYEKHLMAYDNKLKASKDSDAEG